MENLYTHQLHTCSMADLSLLSVFVTQNSSGVEKQYYFLYERVALWGLEFVLGDQC